MDISRRWKSALILALLPALYILLAPSAEARNKHLFKPARTAIEKAVAAMGGPSALQNLNGFITQASGERWILDEGFNVGAGATRRGTFDAQITYDVAGNRLRLDYGIAAAGIERQLSEVIAGELGYLDGQDGNFGGPAQLNMLSDRWASIRKHQRLLNPQLILRDVLANPGSARELDMTLIHGMPHHVVAVAGPVAPLLLYVNAFNGQLTKAETMENDVLRRDVPLEVHYKTWRPFDGDQRRLGWWKPRPAALHNLHWLIPTSFFQGWARLHDRPQFPARVEVIYDGARVHDEARATIEVNPLINSAAFEFPATLSPVFNAELAARGLVSHQYLQSFAALGFPQDGFQAQVNATQLAPGVYHLTGGSHHSLAIEQDANVVIVEAPLNEVRSLAVIDWVTTTFPGKPITHAVMSHHHADHSGGLRTYVAQGASIVMHEAATSFFEAVFTAPSALDPDLLAQTPMSANIISVPDGSSVILANSLNPVGIYSLGNQHAEDLVLVEAGGIVFVVDIYNPFPGAPSLPPEAQLIYDRIIELGLTVSAIAGGHGGVISFSEFEGLINQ